MHVVQISLVMLGDKMELQKKKINKRINSKLGLNWVLIKSLLYDFIPTRCPFFVHALSACSDTLSSVSSKHLEWEAC